MPKRQYFNWETAAMNGTWWVARNAPFSTNYTPDTARLEIIDGKMVSVDDSDVQKLVNSRTDDVFSPAPSPVGTDSDRPSVAQNMYRSPAVESQHLPPVESPRLKQAATWRPQNADTRRSREASAEFLPQDGDTNSPIEDLPRKLNRHHVLPPINSDNKLSNNLVASENSETEALVENGFGQTTGLSDHPGALTRAKELEILAKRVREELTGLSANQLQNIYLKLAEADAQLTGYISFQQMQEIFRQSKVDLSATTLRLTASMFLSVYRSNLVNYEGLVSFIANSLQARPDSEDRELTGTGALRRLIEKQLLAGGCSLEYEKIWNFFQQADRSRRDRLSRDQIKRLVAACRLPLSDFVVDQVLNRCNVTSDRYSWQDFLGYIEHVYPVKTSLTIPPTKRRVKEIPTVNSDWPEQATTPRVMIAESSLGEELSKLETIVQETRKRLKDEKRDGSYAFRPWFERFMHMTKAVYGFNQPKSGYMSILITRWIIQEYSKAYNLGLDEAKVDLAMKPYTEGDKVAIEPFLKTLVSQGP